MMVGGFTMPAAKSTNADRSVSSKLEQMKKRLLDTGKRNKMMNYRETKRSTLKLLQPSCRDLFNRLVIRDETLTFQTLMDKDQDLRAFAMLTLMKSLGHPIEVRIGDIETGASTIAEQKATLKNLRSKARLALEEKGTNILYISFGFLRWREKASTTSAWMTSPLLMVPVALTVESLNAPYKITKYDDDVVVNPTLSYKLDSDLNIRLPDFEADDERSIDRYFEKIEKLADSNGWQLIREANLGLVSFLKINMYFDLENKRDRLLSNPNIRAICGDRDALSMPSEARNIHRLDMIDPQNCFQVIDADSSQQEAIRLSNLGVSFVMQGPPGTGKSQTITNIIAETLAAGKKVLFVSEKAAALEVVLRRLTEAHLDDFCLSLHNYKANRRYVLDQLAHTLQLKRQTIKNTAINDLVVLAKKRDQLNQYAAELHEVIPPLGLSLYQVFGEIAQYSDHADFYCSIDDPAEISDIQFQEMCYYAGRYADAFSEMSCGLDENPWKDTLAATADAIFLRDVAEQTAGLADDLRRIAELLETGQGFRHPLPTTLNGAEIWKRSVEALLELPPFDARLLDLPLPLRKKYLLSAKKLRAKQSEQQQRKAKSDAIFDDSILCESIGQWIQRLEDLGRVLHACPGWADESMDELFGHIGEAEESDRQAIAYLQNKQTVLRNMADLLEIEKRDITIRDSSSIPILIRQLRDIPEGIPIEWFQTENAENAIPLYHKLEIASENKSRIESKLQKTWMPAVQEAESQAIDSGYLQPISPFAERYTGFGQLPLISFLEQQDDVYKNMLESARHVIAAFHRAETCFSVSLQSKWEMFDAVGKLARSLLSCTASRPEWFIAKKRADAAALVEEANDVARKIENQSKQLLLNWKPEILEADSRGLLSRFLHDYRSAFSRLKPQYKRDMAYVTSMAKNRLITYQPEQIVEVLVQVQDIQDLKAWFYSNEKKLADLLGEYAKGKESDWRQIRKELQKIKDVLDQVDSFDLNVKTEDFGRLLQEQESVSVLNEIAAELTRESLEGLEGGIRLLLPEQDHTVTLDQLILLLGEKEAQLASAEITVKKLAAYYCGDVEKLCHVEIYFLHSLLKELESINREQICLNAELREMGAAWEPSDSEPLSVRQGKLQAVMQFSRIAKKENVPGTLYRRLCGNGADIRRKASALCAAWDTISDVNMEHVLQFIPSVNENDTIGALLERLSGYLDAIQDIQQTALDCNVYSLNDIPLGGLLSSLHIAEAARDGERELQDLLSSDPTLVAQFGCVDDWGDVIAQLEAVNGITNAGLSEIFDDRFLRRFAENTSLSERIGSTCEEMRALLPSAKEKVRAFCALFDTLGNDEDLELSFLRDKYTACMDHPEYLDMWLNYQDVKRDCLNCRLGDFVKQMEIRNGKAEDPVGSLKLSFFQQWYHDVISTKPAVSRFKRYIQDETVSEFSRLDQDQFATAQQRVRMRIMEKFPDIDMPVAAGDELNILKHEIGKKAKIMPIRRLFKEIPNLLLTLKPCLMMSPLSVSYFLEADSYQFDLVIFDEASQIFPQDALGSIMRGKQVIIAGDTKQLPPTNFFQSGSGDQSDEFDSSDIDDENIIDEGISDSILEEAADVMNPCMLLWHYRSRSEQLIAFSNQEIYDNRLVTFPGCREKMPDTGVEFVYVPDGCYAPSPASCNEIEAERCARLVFEHFRQHPDRSLGVITFSEKQQQTVLDALQALREKDQRMESFFQEDRPDSFFVKNLENVQGDERDTIFFSVGYGYTEEQKTQGKRMSLRFGPLSLSGGERRLNVAITRARINVKVISSILPKDIDLSRVHSDGVRLLYDYLNYAIRGTEALHTDHQSENQDLLRGVLKDFLTANGYRVQENYGSSGYRIDLAVAHLKYPDRFLAAVECDGYHYASAGTCRERERLRTSVLQGMGWNVYRVWSVEWCKNPQLEGGKLLSFLKKTAEQPIDLAFGGISGLIDNDRYEQIVEEITNHGEQEKANRYRFIPYVEADPWKAKPSRAGYAITLKDHILHIVKIEQPISMTLLYQRLAAVMGAGKAATRMKTIVDDQIRLMADKLQIDHGFVSLTGFTDVKVRIHEDKGSQRTIQQIAPAELRLAMYTVASNCYGLTEDALIGETSRALGYARKSANIHAVLANVLRELKTKKWITFTDGKVNRVTGWDNG